MRPKLSGTRSTILLALAGLAGACGTSEGGGTGPGGNPAIAITISKSSLTIQQGASDNLVATITRSGGFTGAVTIATEGAPAGVAATASNVATANGTTTGTITVAVGGSVAPGTYNLTVRATGTGVDAKTVSLSLTVTATPAIALALNPTALSLAPGAAGSAAVTITRTNFAGTVDLTLEGAPAGVTGMFTPAAATGTSSSLAIQVAGTVTPGTYDLTVRGTGSGVTAVTAGLQLTVTVPASYTMSVGSGAVSVAQGASGQQTVTLVRTNFTGAVDLTLEGAPTGVTSGFNPAAPSGNTSTLTLMVAASVAAGDYALTVRGTATGLADRTATFTLTVTAVAQGAYTLGTTPPGPVNLIQNGASVNVVVDINRTGGFAGSVSLAVSGAPAGLTTSLNPASTTGNASTLTLSATAAAPLGNIQLTITGTATGLTDRTVNLMVNVSAGSGGGGNVSLDYSACLPSAKPIWLAVQNGSGAAWTAITGAADVYTFNANQSKVGLATVTAPSGFGTQLSVSYYSGAEIVALGSGQQCPTPPAGKQLTAATANLVGSQIAAIYLGGGSGFASLATPTAAIQGVANGTFDLTAYASTLGGVGSNDRVLLRRDINTAPIAPGDPIGAALDFTGSESASPVTASITVGGRTSGESIVHGMTYQTRSSCDTGLLYGSVSPGLVSSFTAYGVPAGMQRASDYHGVNIIALTGSTTRTVSEYFQALANRTVNLPSQVPATTPSVLGGPYKRLRFQFTLPSDLNQAVFVSYGESFGSATVAITASVAGFLGGSQVDLSLPDFSGVAGWNNAWAPGSAAAVDWSATAAGSTTSSPCAGGRIVSSTRTGTS